jgi:GDP-4-dehydro-6-deoxy-D-mannose reductase
MKAFVTGAGGFAGQWLLAELAAAGYETVACLVDVTQAADIRAAVVHDQPDMVFHLAGQANVGQSWSDPAGTFAVNAVGTLNVLQAVLACTTVPRTLIVSSAEVYGTVAPEALPLREDRLPRPGSPYAASKVAAEALAQQAAIGSGAPVVVARSFNHIGPGQAEHFVVSALARRLVQARAAGHRSIPVGNLSPRRDFTDVRDVVRGYRLLAERGHAGAIYNVCSGVSVSIADIAARLVALEAERCGGPPIELALDPALQRPVDLPELRGDATRLHSDTGWEPTFRLDDTLCAVLDHWSAQDRAS